MRNSVVNFSLIVGSTLLCFIVLETALRIAGYNPLRDLQNGRGLILRKSENSAMQYELNPNSGGRAWGTAVKINSHGFRDQEYGTVKSNGVYRVGVIGDSITFGNFLPVEETYSKRLEQLFERHRLSVEVLNFGVGGYDIGQAIAFLEELGLQFDVDEVILGYCMNDAGVASTNLVYIQRAATYGSPIYKSRVLQFLRTYVDRLLFRFSSSDTQETTSGDHANAARDVDGFVDERMGWIRNYISANDNHAASLAWYTDIQRIDKVSNAFDKLKALGDQHDFEVTLLIIPYVKQPVDAHKWAYEIIRHEAERREFSVVEVLDSFTAEGISALRLYEDDTTHPNALGHRLIAERLFEEFRQNSTRNSLVMDESEGLRD